MSPYSKGIYARKVIDWAGPSARPTFAQPGFADGHLGFAVCEYLGIPRGVAHRLLANTEKLNPWDLDVVCGCLGYRIDGITSWTYLYPILLGKLYWAAAARLEMGAP